MSFVSDFQLKLCVTHMFLLKMIFFQHMASYGMNLFNRCVKTFPCAWSQHAIPLSKEETVSVQL